MAKRFWQRCKGWVWNNLELIFAGLVIASAVFEDTRPLWLYGEAWSGEATRSLIIALGAIGGLYGLMLAARRVAVSETNLFNDRLSRAIEALGNQVNLTRNAGLRLINSLLKENKSEPENRELLQKILHGYIRDRAIMPEEDKNVSPRESRTDIALAIEILCSHVPKEERNDYPLDNLDLRKLDFFNLDLQGAKMWFANLQDVKNLSQKQLNGIVYNEEGRPQNIPEGLKLPPARAYDEERVFVNSDMPWSGQFVDAWAAKEIEKAAGAGSSDS